MKRNFLIKNQLFHLRYEGKKEGERESKGGREVEEKRKKKEKTFDRKIQTKSELLW